MDKNTIINQVVNEAYNNLTSLVSLISLEIILIPTFGGSQTDFFEIMIMATGGGIALIIIIISLYMIIRSTEWLNKDIKCKLHV